MWSLGWREEEMANGEMEAAVRNHPPLAQAHFSFHFLSQTVPVTPTLSLFQASELEINRYCFIWHSFIVQGKEIREPDWLRTKSGWLNTGQGDQIFQPRPGRVYGLIVRILHQADLLEECFILSLAFDNAPEWICSRCLLPDKLLMFRNKILWADSVYQKMFRM